MLALAGCERPFVATVEPTIRPADADVFLDVQQSDSLDLRLEVTSFREIDEVTADGFPLQREAASHTWARRVPLAFGVNTFAVRAVDAGGVVGIDTLYAVRLAASPFDVPPLPEARGGHTATLLADGRVLVTGGATRVEGDASDAAFLLSADRTVFARLGAPMQRARVGHTATLLPDGCVLITGGRTREGSRDPGAFVRDAELFDPATGTFTLLPVRGAPILRARHTAILRRVGGTPVVELLGGEGNVGFGAGDFRFGIRDDLRPFALEPDTLRALTPGTTSGTGSPIEPFSGHLTARLTGTPPDGDGDHLIAGAYFSPNGTANSALVLQVRQRGLGLQSVPPMRTARTQMAALPLETLGVLVLGGAAGLDRVPVTTGELYVAAARRWLRLPENLLAADRYGLGLTGDAEQICVLGGFGETGMATAETACYRLQVR